jgi:spore coat polysaccharide biosynthesis predicted glycosyltransferase SpsG
MRLALVFFKKYETKADPKDPVPPVMSTEASSKLDISSPQTDSKHYLPAITAYSYVTMRYVFRADATHKIGAGHVMRLIAIAEEVISRGLNAVFIGNTCEVDWVGDRIAKLGFSKIFDSESKFSPNCTDDVLVFDSYEIDPLADFISLKHWLAVILIADDLTPLYRATLVIHPGLDSSWLYKSKLPLLAGPKYIPIRRSLRDEFFARDSTDHSTRIIVLSGGTDPFGLTGALERVLLEIDASFKVTFLTSSEHHKIEDERFEYLAFGDEFEDYMYSSDLVLSTASTSSFEALALQRPLGLVCAVSNQEYNYNFLTNSGFAIGVGRRTDSQGWMLNKEQILKLIESKELRNRLSALAKDLIDLNGSARIVDGINQIFY